MSSDVYTPMELEIQEHLIRELLDQGIDISSPIINIYKEGRGVIGKYKSYPDNILYSYDFFDRDDERRWISILNNHDKKNKINNTLPNSKLSNNAIINQSYSLSGRDENSQAGEYLNDRIKIATFENLLRIDCLFFIPSNPEDYHSYVGSTFQGKSKFYLDEYYRGIKIIKALTGSSLGKDKRPFVNELKISFYYKKYKGLFANKWKLYDSFIRVNCSAQAFDETMIKSTEKTRLSTRYSAVSPYAECYSVLNSLTETDQEKEMYRFPFLEELIEKYNKQYQTDFIFQDKEKIQKLITLLEMQRI